MGCATDNHFGKDISDDAIFVGNIMRVVSGCVSSFKVVAVAVAVFVAFLSMIVTSRAMGVSMSSKNNEAEKIGEQAGTSYDEDELGVVDLGRFDESSEGFKNNRNTKGNEEHGVEECTKNFSTNPLYEERTKLANICTYTNREARRAFGGETTYAKGEFIGSFLLCGDDSPETNNERNDIVKLMKWLAPKTLKRGVAAVCRMSRYAGWQYEPCGRHQPSAPKNERGIRK